MISATDIVAAFRCVAAATVMLAVAAFSMITMARARRPRDAGGGDGGVGAADFDSKRDV